jgi:cardiolipin synthase
MSILEDIHLGTTLYFLSEWAIRIAMLFWVPNRRSPEAAKGWLLFIFFLPWPGLLLYGLIGRPYTPRWRHARLKRLREFFRPTREKLARHPQLFRPAVGPHLDAAVALAEKLGSLPILGGNAVEVLPRYDESIARLAADIEAAEHHVHLLYYIFRADASTEPVVAALERAVRRGVECRVLVDAMGSKRWVGELFARLKAAGVHCHLMMQYGLLRRPLERSDLRNHRKIAVIDGRVGYTGSQNLIAAGFKAGLTYEEMVVRVAGPVALELQFVFVGDWYVETEEVLDDDAYFPVPKTPGAVGAQVLPSGPTFAPESNQRMLLALIHGARESVTIVTPYFIPDEPLLAALEIAVLRGVRVDLIACEQEDQWLVGHAQKSYYEELLEAGIGVHLFAESFLHAKFVTIDGRAAFVGSSNLDVRSFVLNAEVTLLVYDDAITEQLATEQRRYMNTALALTAAEWSKRTALTRLGQNIARLLSPLL